MKNWIDARTRWMDGAIDAVMQAGRHATDWGSVDDFAAPLASGIYFYRLFVVDGEHDMILERKMLLLR